KPLGCAVVNIFKAIDRPSRGKSEGVLLQQVKRYSEQNHILHQKRNVPDHGGKSACRRRPAIRHDGMIVIVHKNVKTDPNAPSTPSFLFQNPANNNAPNSHSETPKKYVAPFTPKTGYIQKMRGPC